MVHCIRSFLCGLKPLFNVDRPVCVMVMGLGCLVVIGFPETGFAGGIGGNWSAVLGDTSLTFDWSNPNGQDYRMCGNMDYRICIKPASSELQGICKFFKPCGTTKPCTVVPLTPSTKFKFKILVKAEKKNIWGKWKNCEFRDLVEGTITTQPPGPNQNSVKASSGSAGEITVTATVHTVSQFQFIRLGDKRTPSTFNLNDFLGHIVMVGCDDSTKCGAKDLIPATNPASWTFKGLTDCKKYKVMAFGYTSTASMGTLLGEATGKTGASCKTDDVAELFFANYPAETMSYATRLSKFYGERCTSIFEHLTTQYPEVAADVSALADSEMVGNGAEMLQYLNEDRLGFFLNWQNDPELRGARLDLSSYLQDHYPILWAQLTDETYEGSSTGVPAEPAPEVTLQLSQNAPNPFRPPTSIFFGSTVSGRATLVIFDVQGRHIRTLFDQDISAGESHGVSWDGIDESGRHCPAGIYCYRLNTPGATLTRKLVLVE